MSLILLTKPGHQNEQEWTKPIVKKCFSEPVLAEWRSGDDGVSRLSLRHSRVAGLALPTTRCPFLLLFFFKWNFVYEKSKLGYYIVIYDSICAAGRHWLSGSVFQRPSLDTVPDRDAEGGARSGQPDRHDLSHPALDDCLAAAVRRLLRRWVAVHGWPEG